MIVFLTVQDALGMQSDFEAWRSFLTLASCRTGPINMSTMYLERPLEVVGGQLHQHIGCSMKALPNTVINQVSVMAPQD